MALDLSRMSKNRHGAFSVLDPTKISSAKGALRKPEMSEREGRMALGYGRQLACKALRT